MVNREKFGKNIKGKKYFSRKATVAGIVIKATAVLSSIYGMLMSSSSRMFTFFTHLSNMAISSILLVFLIFDVKRLKTNGACDKRSNRFYTIKFMFTISITLTFLVYLFLLGPTSRKGLLGAYLNHRGGSFCVHFITPVLAVLDFCLFDYEYQSKARHAGYATVPPLVYVLFVVIAANCGVRWYDNMYAPYNFLNFGASTGWFGFDLSHIGPESLGIGVAYMLLALLLVFWGIGFGYLKVKDARRKYIYGSEG